MPTDKDLDKPGVAGTSDAIKKDALEAKMRRDKVRFLGTVDCRYYPDAIGALTAALRTDGSECVRYEAALALGHGCCCNQKTIDALDASVSGTEKDGNPAERSVRVRCAAAAALEHCLACYVPPPVEYEEPKVEQKENIETAPPPGETPLKKLGDVVPNASKQPVTPTTPKKTSVAVHAPTRQSVEAARRTLAEFNALLAAYQPQAAASPPADRHSVYQLVKSTAAAPEPAFQPVVASMTPVSAPSAMPVARPYVPPMMERGGSVLSPPIPAEPVPPRFVAAPMPPALSSPPADARPRGGLAASGVAVEPVPPQFPAAMPPSRVAAEPQPPQFPAAPMPPSRAAAEPQPPQSPAATMPPGRVSVEPTSPPVPPAAMPPARAVIQAAGPVQPANVTAARVIEPVVGQVLHGETVAERHAAIRQLVRFDWHENPLVVSALLAGAKNDAVPAVRVDCIRHIAAYRMTHPQVLTDLGNLASDDETWVKDEAAKALAQLQQPNP
jgi:hypothetical protein